MPPLVVPTNTTQLLAEITNRGLFEMLVRRVLQIAEPTYRTLVQTGTNQAGETITSPVDGIGREGNRYILLESTTTDLKKLPAKWLAPKKKKSEGDLLKAAREASTIRKQHPDAGVTVVLATNERVDNELYLEVQQKAGELGVDIDIWDQSRLAVVLDTHPSGQALRNEYLGIPASLVSRELLTRLAGRSTREHAATLLTAADAVPRALVRDVCAAITTSPASLRLLRGGSGYGKSTASQHVMRRWVEKGHLALWLPETTLQSSSSIQSAVETIMEELNGNPLVNAWESLLDLVGEGDPLIVIVDDVRQLSAPAAALRKLLSWSQPLEGTRPRLVFVVPVWPEMLEDVSSELRAASWVETVEVGPYTREESVRRVQVVPMTTADAETFAALLGDDPFLIGRWAELLGRGTAPSPDLARNVLREFVQDALLPLAGALTLVDIDEVEQIVVRLSRRMMEMRDTRPSATAIRETLTEKEAQVVDALARQARILAYRTEAGRRTIAFRHDRLEDHFFSRAAADLLGDSDPTQAVSDPYFARAVGLALASSAIEHLPPVAEDAPLALFEALRFAVDVLDRQTILAAASEWLAHHEPHPELQRAILSALREAEGEGIRALVEQLPERGAQQLVRLHHGDTAAAIPILRAHSFLPSATFKAFENAVEHARSHHAAEMTASTKAMLADKETAYQGLALAGYLALPELGESILQCWERSSKEYEITTAALWAAARCAGADAEAIVGPVFEHYVSLAEQRPSVDELRLAFKHAPSPAASAAIAKIASTAGATARGQALWMLQRVDHPDVFRMYVADAVEHSIFRALFVTDARPSAESRAALRSLWQDTNLSERERKSALNVWAATATPADIPDLQLFADDALLGATITRVRARLGDRTAAPALAKLGMTDAGSLVWAHRIWSPELRATVETQLKALADPDAAGDPNAPHHLARVMRHVPASEAEEMLEAHWPALRRFPLFIQSAIVTGTSRALALAHAAVEALPVEVYAFRHVAFQFGMWHSPDHESYGAVPEIVLTTRHLAALSEFIPAIHYQEIADVLDAALRRGWFPWLHANFDRWTAHLSEEERNTLRSRYLPSDDDLRAELLAAADWSHASHYWVREGTERGIEGHRLIDVAVRVAQSQEHPEAWEDVIVVLAHVGTRADLTRIMPLLPQDSVLRAAFDDIAFAVRRRTLR